MKVIYDKEYQKVPIKIWSDEVEVKAMQQLKNISSLPFVYKHVAAMPDVHYGLGATVGSVIATDNAIIPAAVGVDIGCGMMAVKTDLNHKEVQDNIEQIRKSIERSIPVGFGQHKDRKEIGVLEAGFADLKNSDKELYDKARKQMGTLGGGNHFIEVCLDADENVWVMLHSGSRGTGNIVARRHIETAKDLMKKMFIDLPDPDLAYLVQNTPEFDRYVHDLNWCQEYAMQNRIEMMNLALKDISFVLGMNGAPIKRVMEVNCHHNYTEKEHHFGNNVWVTRKGAVRARKHDYGIIPGSMGTKSYIVKGKGIVDSFCSCSHGAGRRMSRNEAKKYFTRKDLIEQTNGVECRKDIGVIDEIPGAYKDIDTVMENQKDLVEIVAVLKQIMCIKG